jgi:hypothetical protein
MIYLYGLLVCCLLVSGCVANNDSLSTVGSTANSMTLTTQNPSTPTLNALQETTSVTSSISNPGPPICPDLPRPAMFFQANEGDGYILRHAASKSECAMQFDPAIGRLLALTANGIYYSTDVTSEESIKQQIIHYASDGTLTRLPLLDADNLYHYFVISPSGSQIAWSQLKIAKITEDDQKILVSELYSANADGSEVQLLHSVDNIAEVKRNTPYWMIQPLHFVDDGALLFTVGPNGKGGAWNAYTGQYSNLYRVSLSDGDITLVYECPVDDYSDCIGDISADNAYFAVTNRQVGEVTVFQMDGTAVATYTGPGQGYIGRPTFSPTGDLVFMSADLAEDQFTIEQAYIGFVVKPYEKAAVTLVREPLSFIWDWADDQHILYTAEEDKQFQESRLSVVSLNENVERLPKRYGYFHGILPE